MARRGLRYQERIAKHDGRCVKCRKTLEAGQAVKWDAELRLLYCLQCGRELGQGSLFEALEEPLQS
jgi:uncharacterized protein with PIN domain